MKSKSLILLLVFMLMSVNFLKCSNISAARKQPMIYLDYKIDQKMRKVVFPHKKLAITAGQTICLKTNDLLIGGDFLDVLDIDWEDKLNESLFNTYYYLKGINSGTRRIQVMYTKNSGIRGEIEINVVGKVKLLDVNKVKKIYYSINSNESELNQSIVFFPNKFKLKIGQRIIILPKDIQTKQNLLTESNDSNILSESGLFNEKGNRILFKAIAVGNVQIKCFIAHAAFLKGILEIQVTK